MSSIKLQNITYTIKASGGDSRKMHLFAIDIIKIHPFGREMTVKEAVTHKRAKVGGPMVFGDGFRVCRADAETGHKCHRRQAREGAAGGGRITVETGDEGLSATGTSVTKNH